MHKQLKILFCIAWAVSHLSSIRVQPARLEDSAGIK